MEILKRFNLIALLVLLVICAIFWCGTAHGAKTRSSPKTKSNRSGIYGKVLRIGFPTMNPEDLPADQPQGGSQIPIRDCLVIVRRMRDKRIVARARSNRYGCFKITLRPGRYQVHPVNPRFGEFGQLDGSYESVIVWRGFYSEAKTVFDGGW